MDLEGTKTFEATDLLEKIILKGGLIGRAAEYYSGDKKKAAQFIKECSEQCKNKVAQDMWGEELTCQILNYAKQNQELRCNPTQ